MKLFFVAVRRGLALALAASLLPLSGHAEILESDAKKVPVSLFVEMQGGMFESEPYAGDWTGGEFALELDTTLNHVLVRDSAMENPELYRYDGESVMVEAGKTYQVETETLYQQYGSFRISVPPGYRVYYNGVQGRYCMFGNGSGIQTFRVEAERVASFGVSSSLRPDDNHFMCPSPWAVCATGKAPE